MNPKQLLICPKCSDEWPTSHRQMRDKRIEGSNYDLVNQQWILSCSCGFNWTISKQYREER